jgi:hypothetical protein
MALSRPAQVREAVRAIKALYALGQRLPPKADHAEGYQQGTMRVAAEKTGVNEDTLRKARAFADPVGGYTPVELENLCALITALQPDQPAAYQVSDRRT